MWQINFLHVFVVVVELELTFQLEHRYICYLYGPEYLQVIISETKSQFIHIEYILNNKTHFDQDGLIFGNIGGIGNELQMLL